MAFINLRRKKGIYLGGDMRVAFLSLSFFLSPLFIFSRDSRLPIVCVLQCETERGKVGADCLVSSAIKRSLIRRCHFWQNHFRVVPTMTRRAAFALSALTAVFLNSFRLCLISGRRITEYRRVFTTAVFN